MHNNPIGPSGAAIENPSTNPFHNVFILTSRITYFSKIIRFERKYFRPDFLDIGEQIDKFPEFIWSISDTIYSNNFAYGVDKMAEKLTLPWGKETISLALPENWKIKGTYEPTTLPPVSDPTQEVLRSLKNPIGSQQLPERINADMKVAVVIDDISRPTPVHFIYPQLLAELKRVGIKEEEITIVPAIGLHREMDEGEIRQRLGISAQAPLHFVNPTCDDLSTMEHLGTTSRGTEVWINHIVAQADFVISIGCIEPHIIASFGGGYKNILPGVAGRITTAHNHTLNCTANTFNMVGQPIKDNPMRLDLEEGCRMLKPPVFIINAILNNIQQVVKIVAGDPVEAHRAGTEISANLYGVKIPGPADIVITDSHPMDSDLRQGVKALANTIRALKPGGVIITLVRAEEGVGVFGLANANLPFNQKSLKAMAPALLPLVSKVKIKGLGEEDRFFLYFALQAMLHGSLYLYGPSIPVDVQKHLPFVQFFPTIEDAIAAARKKFPRAADVIIFPSGGISFPYFE
jgi:nickel-dependent lactate racemase